MDAQEALRVQAAELKLREVLQAAAPGVKLAVHAKEQGAGCLAEVDVHAAHDAGLEKRLRDALGAIAVQTVFRFAG